MVDRSAAFSCSAPRPGRPCLMHLPPLHAAPAGPPDVLSTPLAWIPTTASPCVCSQPPASSLCQTQGGPANTQVRPGYTSACCPFLQVQVRFSRGLTALCPLSPCSFPSCGTRGLPCYSSSTPTLGPPSSSATAPSVTPFQSLLRKAHPATPHSWSPHPARFLS